MKSLNFTTPVFVSTSNIEFVDTYHETDTLDYTQNELVELETSTQSDLFECIIDEIVESCSYGEIYEREYDVTDYSNFIV